MASDEQSTSRDPRRAKLLEEIKRRAEEAELRRIEDDEKEVKPARPRDDQPRETRDAAPFPVPGQQTPPVSSRISREQKASVLRDRLAIALERGRLDKAEELLKELTAFVPTDPEIEEYRRRIVMLREERAKVRARPRAPEAGFPPPVPEPRATPPEPEPPESGVPPRPQTPKKSTGELLQAAHSYYQQEKYDQSLDAVDCVLDADPDNTDATGLKEQIVRAKQISEMVQKEEERRKAEEARAYPEPSAPAPPPPVRADKDVWGPSQQPATTGEFELAPQEAGPAAPPRRPLTDRMAERISRVEIPWKPILAVAVVLAGAFLLYRIWDYVRTTVSPARASILVLPPVFPAGDSSLFFLGDGVAEALIQDLALVPDLRVIGPVTALGFRDATVSNARLARGVGAEFFLQWSMMGAGREIIIQATLYDTASTESRWVSRNQSLIGDLPAVRSDLARGILRTMKIPETGDVSRLLQRRSTALPAAYDAFLRGRFVLRNADRYPAALAADYFGEALRLDSAFAEGHAAFGWATMLATETSPEPSQGSVALALNSVQAAVGFGWTTSETFRVWGMAELFRGQYEKARERFEEAVSMSPSDPEAQRRLAVACIATGEYDQALQAAQAAVQNDPGNAASYSTLGNVYQFLGQYVHAGVGKGTESREALSRAVQAYEQGSRFARDRSEYSSRLHAEALVYVQRADRSAQLMTDRVAQARSSALDLYRLARIEQAAGQPRDKWARTLERAQDLVEEELRFDPSDTEARSVLALIQTRLGQFREAQESIQGALEASPENVTVIVNAARVFALQREKTRALDLLRRALSRNYSLPAMLDMDLYNLRSEEAFLPAVTD